MAARIEEVLGLDVELIVGQTGEYTVWADGEKIAEKVAGRFPDPDDILYAVRERLTR